MNRIHSSPCLVSEYEGQSRLTDLAPDPVLESSIQRILKEQRARELLRQYGLQPIRKVLLDGPPGTGKTLTADIVTGELGETLCVVRTDQVIGSYLGDTGHNLRELFERVRQKRVVVLIDEFDCLGSARGECRGAADRELNHAVALILQFIEDDVGDSIVLCATNYVQALDRALFRRFDMRIRYSMPNTEQARWLIAKTLEKIDKAADVAEVAASCDGLCHADIVAACQSSAKDALLDGLGPVTRRQLENQLQFRKPESLLTGYVRARAYCDAEPVSFAPGLSPEDLSEALREIGS